VENVGTAANFQLSSTARNPQKPVGARAEFESPAGAIACLWPAYNENGPTLTRRRAIDVAAVIAGEAIDEAGFYMPNMWNLPYLPSGVNGDKCEAEASLSADLLTGMSKRGRKATRADMSCLPRRGEKPSRISGASHTRRRWATSTSSPPTVVCMAVERVPPG